LTINNQQTDALNASPLFSDFVVFLRPVCLVVAVFDSYGGKRPNPNLVMPLPGQFSPIPSPRAKPSNIKRTEEGSSVT
jgi:hypothetical protein